MPRNSPQAESWDADRVVLLALFKATNGTNWKIKRGWDKDVEIEEWYGVRVDDWGRVKKIELSGNGLTGACILFSSSTLADDDTAFC